MSAFSDTVYQATWNQQIFQGKYNDTSGQKPLLFNPASSGKNILIVSYVISSLTTVVLTIGTGLFTYFRASVTLGSPATSTNISTNVTTGVAGNLVLNTDAGFGSTTGHQYGQGDFDLQALSSVSLYGDILDPNLTPIILYPGDAFGISSLSATGSNLVAVQFTTVEL